MREVTKMVDAISRQAAIEIVDFECGGELIGTAKIITKRLSDLPPAQPEPSIPLSWIEKEIEWLKSLDDGFSTLTAMQISAMVKKWKEAET